jgi:hypothetical protein
VDLDAAREHLRALFVPHQLDVVGRAQTLDVNVSCTEIEGAELVYHRPVSGTAVAVLSHQQLYCSAAVALRISPDAEVHLRFTHDCNQLFLRVEKNDLERHLETQLGRKLGRPLEFAPAVP